MEEEEKIIDEINKVFETTPNREEAEKIILGTLAPQMDETIKKFNQALNNWQNKMKR